MTTFPEAVAEYSIKAAESFLQTAVFVDDRIYQPESRSDETRAVVSPKARKKAIRSAASNNEVGPEGAEAGAERQEIDGPADTYEIVNHFAKKQIVCSLYQPKKSAQVSSKSDIFPLCKAADIVVIDWDLYGDRGKKAKELADGLVRQAVSDVPEQLRLILIYTQELNLLAIANDLYETIKASLGERFDAVDGEAGLVFETDNSRIVVLGKPGRARAEDVQKFVVDEKDLADVAVREFAKLASGLLQAASLLGLAEIRKNSRKILSKFSADLDPAFLTHLAMSLPDEDASSHVIPLLISEIEAVLEDALPTPLMSHELLKDWCENVWVPGDHLDQDGVDYRRLAAAICTTGFREAAKDLQNDQVLPSLNSAKDRTKKIRKAANILLPSNTSDGNHRFSHLMSSRTFYGERAKALTLGCIVRETDADRFLLCVQPVCDSVRLRTERVFVFVEMRKNEGGNSASHVVLRSHEPPLELVYTPKSYRSFTTAFSPNQSTQIVLAKKEGTGELFFEDTNGRKYRWIDQLRASHAQRAVEKFASDLSRVGLTESEWLRRLDGN